MFGWFSKKNTILVDPVFGEMVFMGSYWEAMAIFPPTSKEVELFIDGNEDGLTDSQYLLFYKVADKYQDLTNQIYPILKIEGEAWSKNEITDIESVFTLTAISIPLVESKKMEWDFMYESNLIGTPCFDVKFKFWNATGVVDVST